MPTYLCACGDWSSLPLISLLPPHTSHVVIRHVALPILDSRHGPCEGGQRFSPLAQRTKCPAVCAGAAASPDARRPRINLGPLRLEGLDPLSIPAPPPSILCSYYSSERLSRAIVSARRTSLSSERHTHFPWRSVRSASRAPCSVWKRNAFMLSNGMHGCCGFAISIPLPTNGVATTNDGSAEVSISCSTFGETLSLLNMANNSFATPDTSPAEGGTPVLLILVDKCFKQQEAEP